MLQIGTLSRLDLGIKDENNARDLYIDMNTWYTDYPNATFSVWHKRNGDQTKYAASGVTFDRETGILKWTPDAYDTFYVGKGLAEIRCTENDVIKKTKDIITEVERSLVLGSGQTLASGWQAFLNAVESAKNGAQQAEGAAEAAIQKWPYIDEDTKTWFVWDVEAEEFVDTGIYAGGDPTALIDDNAGDGVTDKTWSADKLVDRLAVKADRDTEATEGNFAEFDENGNLVDSGHKHSDYLTEHQDISGKADKDPEATEGNFAEFDDEGNPVDSGHKHSDYLTEHQDISGKADKDTDAVEGNFAAFDDGGNPVDSGHKHSDYLTEHQDISGKADKDTDAVEGNFAAFDDGGNPVDSGHKHSDYLTEHQDISGKADKVAGATSGNFAGLDANGNLTDSGNKPADFLLASQKGAASGLAELDSSGKVPSSQLPSYVDDVLEYEDAAHFPAEGESGKIYVALDTNLTYRWGGSAYAEISKSLALGETDSTAYRGDRGAAAYAHAVTNKGSAFVAGFYKITTNSEGHVISVTAVEKSDITALGIPGSHQDISGKADKDTDAVEGNFAAFDANGNPVDSGHKHSDYLTQHQDISGKADKDTDAVTGNFAAFDAGGNPVDSGHKHSDYLTEHQDISGKVDKVAGYGLSKNDFSDAEKQKLDGMMDAVKLSDTNDTPASVISFPDGAPYPMQMQFAIEPVQSGSGDPSPSNVRPITGFDGANIYLTDTNLFDEKMEQGTYDSNTGETVSSQYRIRSVNGVKITESASYTFSCDVSTNQIYLFSYGLDGTFKKDESSTQYNNFPYTVTLNADRIYKFGVKNSDNTTISTADIEWIKVEKGTSATPYVDRTYPITFPSAAGTVYGGTVTVNPDGTGKLAVTHNYVDLGDLYWTYISSRGYMESYSGAIQNAKKTVNSKVANSVCTNYKTVSRENLSDNCTSWSFTGSTVYLQVFDSNYTNASTFKTAMSGVKMAYELAEPVTYQLTPGQVLSLLGMNNVWADTGDIQSLSYVRNTVPELIRQDTAGQITEALAPVQDEVTDAEEALAIVIDGDTAPKAIASGKYLFVKNHSTLARGLYKVTSDIASGANVTSNNTEPDEDGAANALSNMARSIVSNSATITISNVYPGALIYIYYGGSVLMGVITPGGFMNLYSSGDTYVSISYSNGTVTVSNPDAVSKRINIITPIA